MSVPFSRREFLQSSSVAVYAMGATGEAAAAAAAEPTLGSGARPRQDQGERHGARSRSGVACDVAGLPARPTGADRYAQGMQRRRVRHLHGSHRRQAHECLPDARRTMRRSRSHDGRRNRTGRRAPSGPAGFHRSRRVPVRVLHVGADHLGGRMHRGRTCRQRSRSARVDERQPVSLLVLSADHSGRAGCRGAREGIAQGAAA